MDPGYYSLRLPSPLVIASIPKPLEKVNPSLDKRILACALCNLISKYETKNGSEQRAREEVEGHHWASSH